MSWDESINVSKEAQQEEIKEIQQRWQNEPIQMWGYEILRLLVMTSCGMAYLFFQEYILSRSLAGLLIRNPTFKDHFIINFIVSIIISFVIMIYIFEWPDSKNQDEKSV